MIHSNSFNHHEQRLYKGKASGAAVAAAALIYFFD